MRADSHSWSLATLMDTSLWVQEIKAFMRYQFNGTSMELLCAQEKLVYQFGSTLPKLCSVMSSVL